MQERLFFRNLVHGDIPAVKELVKDLWDGHDYMPHVIKRWLTQAGAIVFGAFEDLEMTRLVGIARVRWLSNDIAWLEGGRVAPDRQKTGIGKALLLHAMEIAKEGGASVARYDTDSQNEGSVKLAKQFGFKQIDYMQRVVAIPEILLPGDQESNENDAIYPISAEDALLAYESIENPPKEMLCAGFIWIPRTLEHFTNRTLTFFSNDDAILLVLARDEAASAETPRENERRLVIHGDATAAAELVRYQARIFVEQGNIDRIELFCPDALLQPMLDLGFEIEEGPPGGSVLFEIEL